MRSDHTVVLASAVSRKHYPDPLRRIHHHEAEQDRSLRFLSNNFDLPALTVCLLYKSRWLTPYHLAELKRQWIEAELAPEQVADSVQAIPAARRNRVERQAGPTWR